jgi:hypothetical protein
MTLFSFIAALILTLPVHAVSHNQHEREFEDKDNGYRILLVGDWQPVTYTDAFGRKKTEFVFHNRDEGLLTITRLATANRKVSELLQNDLNDLKLNCSCVYSGEQEFKAGGLSGLKVAIYYTDRGKTLAGSWYYLKDGEVAWVLRFIGKPGSAGLEQRLMDLIAGSFCTVCPF